MNGQGIVQDYSMALKWSLAAATQGHPGAKNTVGVILLNGFGVLKDTAQALKWISEAAEAGFPAAQCNLGVMFLNGVGVNRDRVEALKWFLLAAPSVREAANETEMLVAEMNDAEVAESRHRAESFVSRV